MPQYPIENRQGGSQEEKLLAENIAFSASLAQRITQLARFSIRILNAGVQNKLPSPYGSTVLYVHIAFSGLLVRYHSKRSCSGIDTVWGNGLNLSLSLAHVAEADIGWLVDSPTCSMTP